MVELDEATRRALLAREGPPASARAEILASLRTRLGGPEGPDDPGDLGGGESLPFDGAAAAGGQIAWAAKVVGATLGLAAAGVLTIKLGAVAMSSTPTEPAPTRATGQVSELATMVEPREAIGDAVLPEPPSSASAAALDDAPAREPAVARVAPPSKAESTLAAELALIRAAKQLRASDPEAALARLDLHGKQFPAGSLAPEREAIRVELLCALGRNDAAARARAAFLEHHGDSPLRARVLASCK